MLCPYRVVYLPENSCKKLAEINNSDAYGGKLHSLIVKFCQKLPLITFIIGYPLQIYLIKPVDTEY